MVAEPKAIDGGSALAPHRCPRCKIGRLFPGRYLGEAAFCLQCGHAIAEKFHASAAGIERAPSGRGRPPGRENSVPATRGLKFNSARRRFNDWIDRVIVKTPGEGATLWVCVWRRWARYNGEWITQSKIGGLTRGYASTAFREQLRLGPSTRFADTPPELGRNVRGWHGIQLRGEDEMDAEQDAAGRANGKPPVS